jgi:hypothetical protein
VNRALIERIVTGIRRQNSMIGTGELLK